MGVCGQHHAPTALPPGKTRYPLYRGLGRPQGQSGRVRKISPPPGFDPRTVQPVASRYTDWAIPAHERRDMNYKYDIFSLKRSLVAVRLLSLHPDIHFVTYIDILWYANILFDISLYSTCSLFCIKLWWWIYSIRTMCPKPIKENICCVSTDDLFSLRLLP